MVRSLKRVSSSLMTYQKLYAQHFQPSEKPETDLFKQIMDQTLVLQEIKEKNLALEQGNARLEANVDKLRYLLRQKNIHEANLQKTFLAQKKELKALDENKILKLENEILKLKKCENFGRQKNQVRQ